VKNAIRWVASRPFTQPLFMKMLKLCHAGLNYGGGQSPANSGEVGALKFVRGALGRSRSLMLFDVGANDGEYLHHALRIFGSQVTAYSFEPQSASYERLQGRFASDSRVKLRKAAVGREVGIADLFFDKNGETTASLHRNIIQGHPNSEAVHLTTVDQICSEDAIDHIDLLKIDTEGHEVEVLLGASAMIEAGRISSVQLEFGDPFLCTQYHFLDLWKLLSPRYTVYRILRHGLVEVPYYSPDLELYKVANFLCMQKK
jgi:FkbM family methyltransferase